MISNRNNMKDEKPVSSKKREPAGNIKNMTIEEARKAEKAFNEELEIFKEATRMNRKPKEE